jgi:hypothetical protein
VLLGVIEKLCETVQPKKEEKKEGGWGRNWNWADMAAFLGFDFMGVIVFGVTFGTVEGSEWRQMATSIIPANRFLYWVSCVPLSFWLWCL